MIPDKQYATEGSASEKSGLTPCCMLMISGGYADSKGASPTRAHDSGNAVATIRVFSLYYLHVDI